MPIKAGRQFKPLPDNAPKITKIIFKEKRRKGWTDLYLTEIAGIAHGTLSQLRHKMAGIRFSSVENLANALGIPTYDEFYEDWIHRGRPKLSQTATRDVSKGRVSEPNANQTQHVVATEML
jgi:transcriptional regulator with XRE-family HTH domain